MYGTQDAKDLVAHTVALEAAAAVFGLVGKVPSPNRSLADQVIRAASSVAANLSEGHGRSGRARFNHWRIAYASAKEVDTFLVLLASASVIERRQAEGARKLFDRARALTWRLLHSKKA